MSLNRNLQAGDWFIAEQLTKLATSEKAFTIDDLWHDLRQVEPHLGRAMLYRSIEGLVSEGLIDRIDFADGSHSYRICGGRDHFHLICSNATQLSKKTSPSPQNRFKPSANKPPLRLKVFRSRSLVAAHLAEPPLESHSRFYERHKLQLYDRLFPRFPDLSRP